MSDQNTINCRVRPMDESDLEEVLAWRNHPNVTQYMFTRAEIAWEAHCRWFASARINPDKHLLIYEELGQMLGFVSFVISGSGAVADWGFYASPQAAKGTGRRLARAALDYAFDRAGLHKVCGQVLAYNDRSTCLHERMGFSREGLLREQHFDGERHIDVLCFGLLRSEWIVKQKEFQEKENG